MTEAIIYLQRLQNIAAFGGEMNKATNRRHYIYIKENFEVVHYDRLVWVDIIVKVVKNLFFWIGSFFCNSVKERRNRELVSFEKLVELVNIIDVSRFEAPFRLAMDQIKDMYEYYRHDESIKGLAAKYFILKAITEANNKCSAAGFRQIAKIRDEYDFVGDCFEIE